jgi:Tfp pilus assembly protein PilZ
VSFDKRRIGRTRANTVLELLDNAGHLIKAIGKLLDVSHSGARFATSRELRVGERVRVRMRLPRGSVIEVPGHVVWCRPKRDRPEYGIEFEPL